jgi:nitrate reductase NapE component
MLWLAFNHPLVFWPVLAVAVVCALVLIVVLFKFLRALLRRFSPKPQAAA